MNITPEQVALITVEALEQMVKDAEKKGVVCTVAEIFQEVTTNPQGSTAEYFKVYIKLGLDAIDMLKEKHKNSSK